MQVADTDFVMVTCTTCPIGCRVKVEMRDGQPVGVTGNRCKRGDEYSRAEVTDPRRVVTSTIWVTDTGGNKHLLPIRTKTSVPKRLMFDIMALLSDVELNLPVEMGQVIIPDVLGTGVDVVASRAMK